MVDARVRSLPLAAGFDADAAAHLAASSSVRCKSTELCASGRAGKTERTRSRDTWLRGAKVEPEVSEVWGRRCSSAPRFFDYRFTSFRPCDQSSPASSTTLQ